MALSCAGKLPTVGEPTQKNLAIADPGGWFWRRFAR